MKEVILTSIFSGLEYSWGYKEVFNLETLTYGNNNKKIIFED